MMRRSAIALVVLAIGGHASAAEPDIGPLTKALFGNMTVAYMCRDNIGEAHYLAARTIARDGMAPFVGADQAVLLVDEMETKLEGDARASTTPTTDTQCYDLKAEMMRQIEIERAKLPVD